MGIENKPVTLEQDLKFLLAEALRGLHVFSGALENFRSPVRGDLKGFLEEALRGLQVFPGAQENFRSPVRGDLKVFLEEAPYETQKSGLHTRLAFIILLV